MSDPGGFEWPKWLPTVGGMIVTAGAVWRICVRMLKPASAEYVRGVIETQLTATLEKLLGQMVNKTFENFREELRREMGTHTEAWSSELSMIDDRLQTIEREARAVASKDVGVGSLQYRILDLLERINHRLDERDDLNRRKGAA